MWVVYRTRPTTPSAINRSAISDSSVSATMSSAITPPGRRWAATSWNSVRRASGATEPTTPDSTA
jgi:hypothetical protein